MAAELRCKSTRVPSGKHRRKRISDHLSGGVGTLPERKEILPRKALEQGSLAQRDRSILPWMKEAALGGIDAATRDGRRRLIPSHASVYVAKPVNPPVARQLFVLRKRTAPAAVTRNSFDQHLNVCASPGRVIV